MFAVHELELDEGTLDSVMLGREEDVKNHWAETDPLVYDVALLHTMSMASLLTKTRMGYGKLDSGLGGFYFRRKSGHITWLVRTSETRVTVGYIGSRRDMLKEIFLAAFINDPDARVRKFVTGSTGATA